MTSTQMNTTFNQEVTMYDNQGNPLRIQAKELTLINREGQLSGCNLTFEVSYELYEQIDSQELFNLNKEVRYPTFGSGFKPGQNIEIEVELVAEYVPDILGESTSVDTVAEYFLPLSQSQPESPLLKTESWRGLYVKQQLDEMPVKTGYRTFWAEADFPSESEADIVLKNEDFPTYIQPQKLEQGSLFNVMCTFFQEEEWPYLQVPNEPTLQLRYDGDNGQITCYARVREDLQQFVFYVMCPTSVKQDKRLAIAEFITRANYGMTIGNFEMDFADGELRFKTSIDVEKDRLTSALIRNLVYNSVMTMDRYLPGIMQVIYGNTSPAEAVAAIED